MMKQSSSCGSENFLRRPVRVAESAAMLVLVVFACMASVSEGFVGVNSPLLKTRSAAASITAPRRCQLGLAPMQGRASTLTSLRMEAEGESQTDWEFFTRPRTTNANWGVFFEVQAKEKDIWITGLRAGGHSFADHDDFTTMTLKVLSTEGSAVGKEKDASAWKTVGEAENFRLPRVEVGDSRAQYTTLPFEGPIKVSANSVHSFCIHTNRRSGLALRRKLNFDSNRMSDPYFKEWVDGVTDEGLHFKLVAGLVPGEKLFEEVSTANNARAFVGVIEYDLVEKK